MRSPSLGSGAPVSLALLLFSSLLFLLRYVLFIILSYYQSFYLLLNLIYFKNIQKFELKKTLIIYDYNILMDNINLKENWKRLMTRN